VLAGVYPPERGFATIDGSVSSFTDITLGMDPESTGWENIIFRCVFMGLSFEQAKKLSPDIAEFSELGNYLELPTRTYSAGMFLRLAFAISTSIDPDILIMDEMIAAGDSRFIEKAKRRLNQIIDRAHILVLASHDMTLMQNVCNKVAWLEHGVIKQLDDPQSVIAAYREATTQAESAEPLPQREMPF
jgi:ABC-type polysaccharide/polyol phosphate transport system ATPase subunit